jgi:hypothetical protein
MNDDLPANELVGSEAVAKLTAEHDPERRRW